MKQTFIEEFEHDNTPVQNNLSNLLNKMDFLKLSNLYHFDSKINRDTFFSYSELSLLQLPVKCKKARYHGYRMTACYLYDYYSR